MQETLNDLVNDGGVIYRTMINSFIEIKSEKNKSTLFLDKDKEIKNLTKRDEIKNDPIVVLVEKIELCKNRKEKKKLLAEFNKNIGFSQEDVKIFNKKNEENFNENEENFNEENIKQTYTNKSNKVRNNINFRNRNKSFSKSIYN